MSEKMRYVGGRKSRYLEITETRTGDWIVEAPCGWAHNYGPGLTLQVARAFARDHMKRCSKCRFGSRKIGYEIASNGWREQEGTAS